MWKLSSYERLARWRTFRKSLEELNFEQALESVTDLWHNCPFSPYYLEDNDPDTWPSPWDLIADNYYCDLAKALGMLYTVYFTLHGEHSQPEIRIYYDPETQYTYNLVIFNQGKYVLNFKSNEVVNIESLPKMLELKHVYTESQLKLTDN